MPGYTVAVSNGGGGPATSITGLIEAGENISVTGSGTHADPYVITAAGGQVVVENAYVTPGEDVAIKGVGTDTDPYVISSMSTDQIKAGTNVTLTGTGTTADPYVISATGGGEPTHLVAGENIAVRGTGTTADPFIVDALIPPRGEPVPITLIPPATATGIAPTLTVNPDGSISFDGAFTVAGPTDEGQSVQFALLPQIYFPTYPSSFPGIASIDQPFQLSAVMVNMAVTGELYAMLPGIEAAATITVHLNGIILWPTTGEN